MVTYPSDWKKTTVGDESHLITKGTTPKSYTRFGAVNFVKVESIVHSEIMSSKVAHISTETHLGELRRSILQENDLLISIAATLGITAVVNRNLLPANTNQALAIARFKNPEIVLFVKALLTQTETQKYFSSLSTTSAQANLSLKQVADIPIVLPEEPEQRAISVVLSGFDAHLANLDELITKKKAIRDGAMKELVSGNSRLGGFGDKWTDISFENMVAPKARIGWQNLRTDEYLDSGYSYIIGGTNFSDGTVDLASCKFVSEERFLMDPAIHVNQGDVLVTKDGTIGKVAVVPRLEKPATLNSGVYVFRPVDGVTRRFLYWVLRSDIFDRFIADLSAGSTIKHLYQKDLGRFHFRAPKDLPEQEAIAEVMSSFEEDLLVLKEEREKVERLKLGAMDDLLTGRVRLPVEEEAA